MLRPNTVLLLLTMIFLVVLRPTDPTSAGEPARSEPGENSQPSFRPSNQPPFKQGTTAPVSHAAPELRTEAASDGELIAPVSDPVVVDDLADEAAFEAPVPMRADLAKRTIRVDTSGRRLSGASAGSGESTLVYSNDWGQSFFGPSGGLATARIADDVFTIVRSTSLDTNKPSCFLDKYVVRVTGDKGGDGSGAGDYTVSLALHRFCPSANATDVIEGSQVEVTVRVGIDVPTAADMVVIEVVPLIDIPIEDVRYLGVRFGRDFCGVQVGAPARIGFSGDRFDFPGSFCAADFGGYPWSAHASFGIDLYARGACSVAHVAYKASNHSRGFLTPGVNVRFAESIQLGVPRCKLIGYELAFKGNGIIVADLRTGLDDADPAFGFQIPYSRHAFFSSALNGVQVEYYALPKPFELTSSELFMTFRTTSNECGPILTCSKPWFGETQDLFFVYNGATWDVRTAAENCYAAFDITLICEGSPPLGACCDMVFLDDEFESVCRDGLAEMNCPFPELWQQGDVCEGVCVGGSNPGAPCTRQVDCKGGDCDGPFPHPCGLGACCVPSNDKTCENLTLNECFAVEPVEQPRRYDRSAFCGEEEQECPWSPCIGRDGDCSAARPDMGCENPFCCADVCDIDPWCCRVEWDELCVEWFQEVCKQPPSNNECYSGRSAARLITIPSSTLVPAKFATANVADPGFCCHAGSEQDPSLGPGSRGVGSIWFKFIATEDTVKVHTCNTESPVEETLLAVYRVNDSTTDQSSCQTLDEIGCSDDAASCGSERLSSACVVNLTPGEMYYIQVAGKAGSDWGLVRLDIDAPCQPETLPLPNDQCFSASSILDGVTPFDLTGSTFDCPGPPSLCMRTMENDLWYDWVAPCSGFTIIDTCDGVDTPDTGIVIYRGCDCPVETGDIIACNDFQLEPCYLGSRVKFEAQEGECYKIRLGGHLGGEPAGPLNLNLVCWQCPTDPVTFTDPKSGTVDARQPHAVDNSSIRQGIDTITVLAPPGADNPVCWSLCETAVEGSPNSITGVLDNLDGSFTISLAQPITTGAATTISYTDDFGAVTRGEFFSHPANATGSSTSTSRDVLAIMGYLDQVVPPRYGIYSSDIDYSGELAAPDILRLIDLLNGGGAFTVWQDSIRPDCGVCCSP